VTAERSDGRLRSIPAPGRMRATVESRRAQIVDACIEELHHNGFPRVKVESVARRAGIDKRTLYDYIGRKEDLLLLIYGHYLPQMLGAVRDARDRWIDPADQLFSMIATHTRIIVENPHFVLFFYRELRYLPTDDQRNVLAIINDIHLEYVRVFTLLETVIPDLPTRDAVLNASSALTMIDMIGLHRHHLASRSADEIAEHIFRALAGHQPPERKGPSD
jgi:AcrR family transcriptional regulator